MLSVFFELLVPATILFFCINGATMRFYHTDWFKTASGGLNRRLLLEGGGVSLVVGLANYLTPRLGSATWLAIPFFGIMAAAFVNMFLWWGKEGSERREMTPFVFTDLLLALIASGPAKTVASLIPVLSGLIKALPWMAFWAFLGFMTVSTLFFHYNRKKREGEPATKFLIWGIVLAVLFGLLFASALTGAFKRPNPNLPKATASMHNVSEWWNSITNRAATEPAETAETAATEPSTEATEIATTETTTPATDYEQAAREEEVSAEAAASAITYEKAGGLMLVPEDSIWTFYHHLVIKDNYDENGQRLEGKALEVAKVNDYDFGVNPLEEIFRQKIASGELSVKDLANKTSAELFALVTVDDLMTELIEMMKRDPALAAAFIAWYDANMHTRFLGKFFSEYQDHPDAWMETINAAKESWVKNPDEYREVLVPFIESLAEANKIEVTHKTSGLNDQMYMFGFSDKFVPDVIVMESKDHEGFLLTFTYLVKGEKVVFSYRIDCGFQPTNVSNVMNVTPRSNPNKPATPSVPKSSGGTPPVTTPKSAGGTPATDTGKSAGGTPPAETGKIAGGFPITNPKSPDKGTPPIVIDDRGPGSESNDGVGASYSSKQKPWASTFLETVEELKEEVAQSTGNPAHEAGTPNTPTYTPPASLKADTDSNAKKGTGSGGADTKTPVSPGVTYNTTDTSSTSGTTAGGTNGGNTTSTSSSTSSGTTTRSVTDEPRGTDWGGLPD